MAVVDPAFFSNLGDECEIHPDMKGAYEEVRSMADEFAALFKDVDTWYDFMRWQRFETLRLIDCVIAGVEEHNKSNKISNIVGSTAGVFGGLLVVGGICAAPFTGGVSLAAVAAGSAMSAAGAATNIGAGIISGKCVEGEIKTVTRMLEADVAAWDRFVQASEKVQQALEAANRRTNDSGDFKGDDKVKMAFSIGKLGFKAATMGLGLNNLSLAVSALSKYGMASVGFGKVSMKALDKLALGNMANMQKFLGVSVGAKAARGMVGFSGVLAVVGVVMDGINLFNNIKGLVENSPHEATAQLQELHKGKNDQLYAANESMEDALPVFFIAPHSKRGHFLSHDTVHTVDLWNAGGCNQKWVVKQGTDEKFIIESLHYCARGPFLSHDENTAVDLWSDGGRNQKWQIEDCGDGSFRIKTDMPAKQGPYLSHDGNKKVDLWTGFGENQKWDILGFSLMVSDNVYRKGPYSIKATSVGKYLSHNQQETLGLWKECGCNQHFFIEHSDGPWYFIKTKTHATTGPFVSNDGNNCVDLWREGGGNQVYKIIPAGKAGCFHVLAKSNNKYLSHDGNTKVDLWKDNGSNQTWEIVHEAGGAWVPK